MLDLTAMPIAMNSWLLFSSVASFALVLAWRLRESAQPVTAPKIIAPPLGMATGFSMFAYAPARIPALWALCAFAVGALVFSYPLIKSSKLMLEGDTVRLRRSRWFVWIIVLLFAVRFLARSYFEQYISPIQSASILFVLAFGMIVTWRVRMLFEYVRLQRTAATATSP